MIVGRVHASMCKSNAFARTPQPMPLRFARDRRAAQRDAVVRGAVVVMDVDDPCGNPLAIGVAVFDAISPSQWLLLLASSARTCVLTGRIRRPLMMDGGCDCALGGGDAAQAQPRWHGERNCGFPRICSASSLLVVVLLPHCLL